MDPAPGIHAHAAVGSRAHVPARHARFDVRPPQRPQPLGDAPPLGGPLAANVWVFAAHVRTIVSKRRNPLTREVHADEATYTSWARDLASEKDKELIAARLGTTPEKAGFTRAREG